MIKIVTDTTCSLPKEILDEFNIPMVPQYVHFGEETYRGFYEISPAEFFAKLPGASELPKTSAPPPGDFYPIFDDILAEDPEATILCIHPSSEVSGTVRSARPAAASYPDADIRIIDTRSISVGLALIVYEAAKLARDGATVNRVMDRIKQMSEAMQILFVVDTLEYLAKGGRIGRASHLMGTLLDIKPILAFVDGQVTPHSKARTRKRSLVTMRDLVVEDVAEKITGGQSGFQLAVAHGVCPDEGQRMLDWLTEAINPTMTIFAEVGPAIGVHAGPGVIAVSWCPVD
ncbi:MAG: DegV family protein [Anaerolineae bacterium]|nr:DegV family protein [Anaerolineae bacterium]